MRGDQTLIIPGAEWRDDSTTEVCENRLCRKKFSLLFGKHHCRWCGKIYCAECAPRTAIYHGKQLRQCNACRFPVIFRSFRNSVTGRREAVIVCHILSFLDGRSINALLQSCYTALSEFHIADIEYRDTIQERFPTFFEGARIGKGGSGTVYKCEDRHRPDNPRVAIKVITKAAICTFPRWRNITTELDIMQKVKHRNVAKLLEVFQTPLYLVIVVEVGEGGSLKRAWDFVRANNCDLEVFTASVIAQVSEGLDYLYREMHVVHRDIKHDNIVLSRDFEKAMIIDFGLAEFVTEDKGQFFHACGTIGFASPENIIAVVERLSRFEATGATMHSADMFSLGVVAYMLLSGHKPFRGRKFSDLYTDIRRGFRCEGQMWANISNEAKSLVEQLLQVNPNNRATPAMVRCHPFILNKAPQILKISRKRNQQLSIAEQVEGEEWVYVDGTLKDRGLSADGNFSKFNKRKGLTGRLSGLRFGR